MCGSAASPNCTSTLCATTTVVLSSSCSKSRTLLLYCNAASPKRPIASHAACRTSRSSSPRHFAMAPLKGDATWQILPRTSQTTCRTNASGSSIRTSLLQQCTNAVANGADSLKRCNATCAERRTAHAASLKRSKIAGNCAMAASPSSASAAQATSRSSACSEPSLSANCAAFLVSAEASWLAFLKLSSASTRRPILSGAKTTSWMFAEVACAVGMRATSSSRTTVALCLGSKSPLWGKFRQTS
mmetsp:Transcript_72422/g.209674  ORF Transcript_72422/g.209674 Transcript_72422/m.209674 type:complete len:244 (-) Transcript_72422:592-1323(-)